jgi:DNA polymerase kappa
LVTGWSLDEACLDITEYLETNPGRNVEEIVREMRDRVKTITGLTCSAGIAANRQLAKVFLYSSLPNICM